MDDATYVSLDDLTGEGGLALAQDVLARFTAWDPDQAPDPQPVASAA